MKIDIEYLKKLLEIKKQTVNKTEEELDKLIKADKLLSIPDLFFRLDINSAVGLLDYLGIEKNKIKDAYFELTNIEAYQSSVPKQYCGSSIDE